MRLQLSTHASPGRLARAQVRLLGALVLAALTPALALASHYVVDASGGGDYVTIQGCLDSTSAEPRDSVLVRPGHYFETVAADSRPIVGIHGAAVTLVDSIAASAGGRYAGLTFVKFISTGPNVYYLPFISDCVFEAGACFVDNVGRGANLARCTFLARTWIVGYSSLKPAFVGLHFVHAPLAAASGATGDIQFRQCTFDGPADTLVFAHPASGENPVDFFGCTFRNGGVGLVTDFSYETTIFVDSCTFEDIRGDAVRQLDHLAYEYEPTRLWVARSRFERCGTAIRWSPGSATPINLVQDTVRDCSGDGIVVSPLLKWIFPPVGMASIHSLIVERSGGRGLVIDRRGGPRRFGGKDLETGTDVTFSSFTENRGDGLVVVDTIVSAHILGIPSRIAANLSQRNGGAGFRLGGQRWSVFDNVAEANGQTGLVFRSRSLDYVWTGDSIVSNTCAGNGGDGIRLEHGSGSGRYIQVVERNLSAFNQGNGIATTAPHYGTVAFNDAWKNGLAEYVNVPSASDSNLTVNPQFCKHPADALTLRFGSKCGAGGVYGLIGAEPEACRNQAPSELEGEDTAASAIAFSARPNPARGAVELAVPAGGPDGRIEVLDAQGRRVWSRAVRAGDRVRWTGETAAGQARPGLYLVRLTRPGETRFVRVLWLE